MSVVLYVVLIGGALLWLLTPTGQRPEHEACGRSSVGERRVANAKVVGSTPAARLIRVNDQLAKERA